MSASDLSTSASSGDEGSIIEMAPNKGGRAPARRNDLDMSAAMNMEQKNTLQNLVTVILDGMQREIREVFDTIGNDKDESELGIDPPKPSWNLIPNPRSVKYAHMYGKRPLGTGANGATSGMTAASDNNGINAATQKENVKPGTDASAAPAALATPTPLWVLPRSVEDATRMSSKDEKEILTSSMIELKRDALTQFGKWRTVVLRRVGDIVIKNGGNGGNVASQGQQQGNTRRPGSAGRGRPPRPSGGPPLLPFEESNATLLSHYPPSTTTLSNLPKEKRALILHCMLLVLLGLESYSTYSRILLIRLGNSLHIPPHVLASDELRVAKALSQIIKGIPPEEIAQRRAEEAKSTRRWKVGLAAIGANVGSVGGSGSMAAPLVAAGVGTVFGGLGLPTNATAGLLGQMAENTISIGTLFGLYGARATGKMMDSYARDIQDFAFLPLHGSLDNEYIDPKDLPVEDRRMRVVLCIGGWLLSEDKVSDPFRAIGSLNEAYALRWELEPLSKMGNALETVTKSACWSLAKKEIVGRSVYTSLKESFWPVGLQKISKVIDNPWSVGMVRAEKNGLVLADAIINKVQGERNITLIGYSLGARSIYACLMHLAEKRVFGVIDNVIMMGGPCPTETRVWAAMRSVVAGRLVNVYSKNDFILGFLYRSSTWHFGCAGLQKIQGVQGVENHEVSDIVTSHLRYQHLVGPILKKIAWEDIDYAEAAKAQKSLNRMVEEEKQLDKARDEKAHLDRYHDLDAEIDNDVKKIEEEVKKKNERTKGRKCKGGKQGN